MIRSMRFIILAGIYNSGLKHWQTEWQTEDDRFIKLDHSNWDQPDRLVWVNELEKNLAVLKDDVILVAHSLACLMVIHWANQSRLKVRGALLVSVPDPYGASFPSAARNFENVPMSPLPFPSIVVASQNDPYGTLAHMTNCSAAWGSKLKQVGFLGHINADSGLSNWPEGKLVLNELIEG